MMNTEKEELLELIAHKLRFLESPVQFIGVNNLEPLTYITENYHEQLKLRNLATENLVRIPAEVNLIIIRLERRDIPQMLAQLPQILQIAGLQESLANTQDKIFLIDDSVFSSATDLEQLEMLAEVFYPRFFAFGYEGKAWLKLNI